MHPVQEHVNKLGIDCLIQRLTEYCFMNMKGTVFQPRVLQLNLDNINRLPHNIPLSLIVTMFFQLSSILWCL